VRAGALAYIAEGAFAAFKGASVAVSVAKGTAEAISVVFVLNQMLWSFDFILPATDGFTAGVDLAGLSHCLARILRVRLPLLPKCGTLPEADEEGPLAEEAPPTPLPVWVVYTGFCTTGVSTGFKTSIVPLLPSAVGVNFAKGLPSLPVKYQS
jgi:hypothetical protein